MATAGRQARLRHPAAGFPGQFSPVTEEAVTFQPVEGTFLLSESLDTALSALSEAAAYAVNQTGKSLSVNTRPGRAAILQLNHLDSAGDRDLACPVVAGSDVVVGLTYGCVFEWVDEDGVSVGLFAEL